MLTVTALSDSDGAPGGRPCGYDKLDDGPASFSNYATAAADAAHTVAAPVCASARLAPGGGLATMSGTSQASPRRATTYRFEYGPSTAYGQSSADAPAGGGDFPLSVGADLAGLAPATTYHYRLVATGPDGASVGADRSFTTAPEPATAASAPAPSPGPAPAPSSVPSPSPVPSGGDVAKARREVARRC